MVNLQMLEAQINKRNSAIVKEKDRELTMLARLGRAVHSSGGGDGLDSHVLNAVLNIQNDGRELEDSLRRLLEIEEQGIAVTDEIKKLNVELRNLNNKTQDCMEALARSAWSSWKSGKESINGLEDALDELIRADEHLNSVEDAVSRNERLVGNLGGAILSKGRALFLAGRRRTAASSIDRLWRSVGNEIYSAVDGKGFQGTSVEAAFEAIAKIDARKQEIEKNLLAFAATKEGLEADVENMPGKGSLNKRVSWIRKAINEGAAALENAFRDLGAAWLESEEKEALSPDVDKYRRECIAVREQLQNFETEIHIFESHCKLLELESDRDKQEIVVGNLEAKVKKLQSQFKDAKKAMTDSVKKIDKLKESLSPLPEILD